MVEFIKSASGKPIKAAELMTLAVVDFFDHESKMTQLGYGVKPLYKSTISFKNKMDKFYSQRLAQEKVSIDVYSKTSDSQNANILGSCSFVLTDIVYGAVAPPGTTTKLLNIIPAASLLANVPQTSEYASLGSLKVNVRLRKPISDAIKFHETSMSGMSESAQKSD